MAPPCSPLELLSLGGAGVPQTAAPSSDATGRTGRHACLQMLWKEAEGCEGGYWVPEPQALVLASTHGIPADMWAVEQSAQTHSFSYVF